MNADTKTLEQRAREYDDRYPIALDRDGGYYCRHVAAMTREGLHAKSDVAAELAWRDREIDRLKAAQSSAAEAKVVKYGRQFIAEMLDEFASRATYYIYSSDEVREQARLLREADEADATGMVKAEPLGWIHEDELPEGYPYDAMFPYSKVDLVRMFPVYGPPAASAVPEGYLFRGLPTLIDPSPETEGKA